MTDRPEHTVLIKRILEKLSDPSSESRYFKNQVGEAVYAGGARVKYGLTPGAPDIVGYTSMTITEDMIGKKIAVFTGIEVKTGNATRSKHQKNFANQLIKAGGICGVARKVEDATMLIREL